ncbi:palmitoyl-protein thioesterase, partial [Phenoliferia sp. Uapishka_3]
MWIATFVSLSLVTSAISAAISTSSSPVPVVLWHGLGDRYDAPGLLSLKTDLEERPDLKGVFVWIVKLADDGTSDQRATFFGSANDQVAAVCDQLRALPEIMDPKLNPSGKFDAIGFSQGGQLLRAVVERCGGKGGLNVRNLITVGSQHMGVSSMPPCPPGSSPFGACRLMHLSIVREGLYSNFAQHKIIPAQYFRDEARIHDYLSVNNFLRVSSPHNANSIWWAEHGRHALTPFRLTTQDINNERVGDKEVGPPADNAGLFDEEDNPEPRNETYKENFSALENLVLLRFSEDATVVPPQSAHFTLPSPYAHNCPSPADPLDPSCYLDPLPYSYLPLFAYDYIGLRQLDLKDKIYRGVCEGQHMEIRDDCWDLIASWLGKGDGQAQRVETPDRGRLVVQL